MAPTPALPKSASIADSQIIPVQKPDGYFRYVSTHAARVSPGTLLRFAALARLHMAASRCAGGSCLSCLLSLYFSSACKCKI